MTENNLALHYKVLKQFLDISDDSTTRSKSNTTRAVRAREKLLKLSVAQFRELSTDVYDELKRRIDESNGEPDFLLPKSTFHPKRNQARQKLSSLPQSRFKDLVSDISYEIERREIHIAPKVSSPIKSNHSAVQSSPQKSIPNHDPPINELLEKSLDHGLHNNNQTIGIQPKTVVPTKANLTWSSDEEESEDEPEVPPHHDEEKPLQRDLNHEFNAANTSTVSEKPVADDKAEVIDDLQQKLVSLQSDHELLQTSYTSLQEKHDDVHNTNSSLRDELESLKLEKKSWASSQNDSYLKEIDNLKSANAALRLENQSLKNSNSTPSKDLLRSSTYSKDRSSIMQYSTSPIDGPANNKLDLKKQLESFYDKLDNIDKPPASSLNATSKEVLQLKNDVVKWQKLYEKSRAETFRTNLSESPLTNTNLKSFVASNGLLSIHKVSELQSLVESFLTYINKPTFDADILFDKISKISILSNQIASQGDANLLNSNENSICLRESASHALTATRYYAIYSSILPKSVVERSISEICFTLCDLVSVSKLKNDSVDDNDVDATLINSSNLNGEEREIDGSAVDVRPFKTVPKLKESNKAIHSDEEPLSQSRQLPSQVSISPPRVQSETSKEQPQVSIPPKQEHQFSVPLPTTSEPQLPVSVTREQEPRISVPQAKEQPELFKLQISEQPEILKQQSVELPREQPEILKQQSIEEQKDEAKPFFQKERSILDNLNITNNPSPQGKSISSSPNNVAISPNQNKSNGTASSVRSLASRFDPSKSDSEKENSPRRNQINESPVSNKSSPSSRGIFDRVKQFESPTNEAGKYNKSPQKTPPSNSFASKVGLFGDKLKNFSVSRNALESSQNGKLLSDPFSPVATTKDEKKAAAAVGAIGASALGAAAVAEAATHETKNQATAKPKGILQTLKDRFNYDQPKPEEEPVESDSEKADTSTFKIPTSNETTPSRTLDTSGYDDSEETSPEEKIEMGFFSATKKQIANDSGVEARGLTTSTSDMTIPQSADDEATGSQTTFFKSAESSPVKNVTANATKSSPVKNVAANTTKAAPATKNVGFAQQESEEEDDEDDDEEYSEEDTEEAEARQRQEYRKSMAAATFNFDLFDIDDPDNTLTHVLLYLEHQTVQVIATIQSLLSAIKKPDALRGELREKSKAITVVISQMSEATKTSMNQTRNFQLKEHGSWVVTSLEDCSHRMNILCRPNSEKSDGDFADKNFKQRLAGISFDIAKCTKELVKTVEEASLKEEISNLNARLSHADDLT